MAHPTCFAEANLLLTAPPGHEAEVASLPVRRDDGRIVSCWQLTPADLLEIGRTGVVWLSVWGGNSAPPVLVSGRREDVL